MIPGIKNIYLIEACRKGDPGAQLQVYKLYYNQMFNTSIKLVRNAHAADEIVRESFMVLFERISSFKGNDFTEWLKKLVEIRSVEAWNRNNVAFPGLVTDRQLVITGLK